MTTRQRATTEAADSALSILSRLEAGLQDMVLGGRLVASDIPDDWQWLVGTLSDAREKLDLYAVLKKSVG